MSRHGRSVGTLREYSNMVFARASSSGPVTPFILSATPNAAICASVATPSMIRAIAQPASAGSRSSPAVKAPSTPGQERPPSNTVELPTCTDLP